jgi:ADP-heptose:LPS heptosyltransferase
MSGHILSVLAGKVQLPIAPISPKIFLSKTELDSTQLSREGKPWIAIHSTGTTVWTENKNWFPDRFDSVSHQLRNNFRIVQLGPSSDPPLESDLDLRGRVNPRQAAAIIASCVAIICQVGYLMHAAAAVGTPAVVIYGGFESPIESGYDFNENLFSNISCSPCWLTTKCPYDRECMNKISVEEVLKALEQLLFKKNAKS